MDMHDMTSVACAREEHGECAPRAGLCECPCHYETESVDWKAVRFHADRCGIAGHADGCVYK